ncbi:MAG: hypothetical protein RLZZ393_1279 [Pseudomonadota bacterium]|jgi:hypothetical protein
MPPNAAGVEALIACLKALGVENTPEAKALLKKLISPARDQSIAEAVSAYRVSQAVRAYKKAA